MATPGRGAAAGAGGGALRVPGWPRRFCASPPDSRTKKKSAVGQARPSDGPRQFPGRVDIVGGADGTQAASLKFLRLDRRSRSPRKQPGEAGASRQPPRRPEDATERENPSRKPLLEDGESSRGFKNHGRSRRRPASQAPNRPTGFRIFRAEILSAAQAATPATCVESAVHHWPRGWRPLSRAKAPSRTRSHDRSGRSHFPRPKAPAARRSVMRTSRNSSSR